MKLFKKSENVRKKSFTALMSSVKTNLNDLHPLYSKLCSIVAENDFLSKKIYYMLIVTKPERISSSGESYPKAYQIWALHKSEPAVERELGNILSGSLKGELFFAASADSKLALKREGVEIVEEMKLHDS